MPWRFHEILVRWNTALVETHKNHLMSTFYKEGGLGYNLWHFSALTHFTAILTLFTYDIRILPKTISYQNSFQMDLKRGDFLISPKIHLFPFLFNFFSSWGQLLWRTLVEFSPNSSYSKSFFPQGTVPSCLPWALKAL